MEWSRWLPVRIVLLSFRKKKGHPISEPALPSSTAAAFRPLGAVLAGIDLARRDGPGRVSQRPRRGDKQTLDHLLSFVAGIMLM